MKLCTQDIRNRRNLAARYCFGFAPVVKVRSGRLMSNPPAAFLTGHQVANFILVPRVEQEKARVLSSASSPKSLVLLLRRQRRSCAGKPAHDPHCVRCSTPTTSP